MDRVSTATHYARSGDVHIAYQVVGEGPVDLLFVPGFVSNLELGWDWPPLAAFYLSLASFARLIIFDKRGTGLSDRIKNMPSLDERMDDLHAVMAAVGSDRAVVLGVSEGGPLAVAFAVAHPERTASLALYAPLVKATRAPDYPWAAPPERWVQVADHYLRTWGSPEYVTDDVARRAPTVAGDPAFCRWWGTYRRMGASPGAAADLIRMNSTIDVRPLLPRITVPSLVIARRGDRIIRVDSARYVASHIPGAEYVELEGEDHLPFVGDSTAIVRSIGAFMGADVVDVDVDALAQQLTDERGQEESDESVAMLTERERDVLRWVSRGKSNSEVATALYVAESTVRKHLQNAYRKLGVQSRTAAAAKLLARR